MEGPTLMSDEDEISLRPKFGKGSRMFSNANPPNISSILSPERKNQWNSRKRLSSGSSE